MKVLKIRGTTRWNVNKSVTKRNPFLQVVEKHHMAKVTNGSYYASFRSQRKQSYRSRCQRVHQSTVGASVVASRSFQQKKSSQEKWT